ncbi:hypothetical protein [Pseudomonas leptonychotis]|uniref:hypothetical protein n=1 Tax=Pseudomonas leptonychotis TaxID=2448482 RepID=UPI001981CACE
MIEVALRTAVIKLEISWITRAGCSGVAQQQHGATFALRCPSLFIACQDSAAEQAQRQ